MWTWCRVHYFIFQIGFAFTSIKLKWTVNFIINRWLTLSLITAETKVIEMDILRIIGQRNRLVKRQIPHDFLHRAALAWSYHFAGFCWYAVHRGIVKQTFANAVQWEGRPTGDALLSLSPTATCLQYRGEQWGKQAQKNTVQFVSPYPSEWMNEWILLNPVSYISHNQPHIWNTQMEVIYSLFNCCRWHSHQWWAT